MASGGFFSGNIPSHAGKAFYPAGGRKGAAVGKGAYDAKSRASGSAREERYEDIR